MTEALLAFRPRRADDALTATATPLTSPHAQPLRDSWFGMSQRVRG